VPETPPARERELPEADLTAIVKAFQGGDYQRVVDESDSLRRNSPAYVRGSDELYYLGIAAFSLHRNNLALRALLEFQHRFTHDARNPEVILATVKVYRRLGRDDLALDLLRQIAYLTAESDLLLQAREERADILAGRGEYLESLSVLDEAYRKAGPEEKERLLTRVRELLAVMPQDMIRRSVFSGDYAFPREEARIIYRERLPSGSGRREDEMVFGEEMGEPAIEGVLSLPAASRPPAPLPADGPSARKIGVIIPSEGRLEAYGIDVRRGIDLYLQSLSGEDYPYEIETVYASEKGDDDSIAALVAAEDVLVIIGPLLSSTVERIMPVAEKRSLAILSPTASSPRLNGISPNFFRNGLTLEETGRGLAGFAVTTLGLSRFAIFTPDDVYGYHYGDVLKREVTARGGAIVASGSYDTALTDFSGPIRNLKAAAGIPSSLPEGEEHEIPFDALFLPANAEEAGMIVPQLAFHDIDVSRLAILGGSGLNTPRFPEVGEQYAEGVFFADGFFAASPRMEVQYFVSRFLDEYGEVPGTFSAQAYDAAAIVAEVFRSGAATRSDVLAALGKVKDFPGVTGRTTMTPGGLIAKPPFFGTVTRGRLVSVEARK
jgi:branched-chain amino acid transport system substrate-binding protein